MNNMDMHVDNRMRRVAIIASIFVTLGLFVGIVTADLKNRIHNQPRSPLTTSQKKPEGKQDNQLESSKQYLKENGIDCTHENTYATYNSFAVDPQNPDILYIGIEGRGIYKSQDKGVTWQKMVQGLVAYPDSNDKTELCFPDLSFIYIDPANTNRLLLVIADITTAYPSWPYGETGGIWESLDGAASWKQLITGDINVAGSGSLVVDPRHPSVMYYPVNPDPPTFLEAPIKTSLNQKSSVYKTVDAGKSWQELEMPMLPGLQAMRIFIDPNNSDHILFFTQSHDHKYNEKGQVQEEVFLHEQHGIIETFDGGKTWNSFSERLPDPYRALFEGDVSSNDFSHMIVRPFLFGAEFPGDKTVQKSFYSIDGGKTFHETSHYIWVGRYNPHDQKGEHLLGYASTNAKVVESKNGGKTWETIGTPPEVASYKVKISNFVWDPKDAKTVYMTGDYGQVWQSTDNGKIWQNILSLDTLPK